MTVIEIDLTSPSMMHGKKGFERVVWASKNILTRSVTWLCYDPRLLQEGASVSSENPLSALYHTIAGASWTGSKERD